MRIFSASSIARQAKSAIAGAARGFQKPRHWFNAHRVVARLQQSLNGRRIRTAADDCYNRQAARQIDQAADTFDRLDGDGLNQLMVTKVLDRELLHPG